jgi:ferric-dicitrate binding protein FerR (iron transport regulator)
VNGTERFDLLLERYLDGALEGDARREFMGQLRADGAFRRRFTRTLAMESLLRLPRREAEAGTRRRPGVVPLRRWVMGAAAAFLLGLLGVLWWGFRGEGGPAPARIVRVESAEPGAPPPALRRSEGRRDPLFPGVEVRSGDRIESNGGMVAVRFEGEPSIVTVQPRGGVAFRWEGGAKRLDLDAGTVEAEVAPQPKDRPMRLVTPHGTATVVGTAFTLTVGPRDTLLRVDRGEVDLAGRAGGERLRVAAGQRARTDGGAVPERVNEPGAPSRPARAPERWRLDPASIGGPGGKGTVGSEGVAPSLDTELKGEVKGWLVVTPPPGEPGLVRIGPRLRTRMVVSLDRPREVGLMFLVRPPDDGGIWLANVQVIRKFPAGARQELSLSWDEFRGAAGRPAAALAGMSVYQAFLMTWGPDAGGLRLHELEIESPSD